MAQYSYMYNILGCYPHRQTLQSKCHFDIIYTGDENCATVYIHTPILYSVWPPDRMSIRTSADQKERNAVIWYIGQ